MSCRMCSRSCSDGGVLRLSLKHLVLNLLLLLKRLILMRLSSWRINSGIKDHLLHLQISSLFNSKKSSLLNKNKTKLLSNHFSAHLHYSKTPIKSTLNNILTSLKHMSRSCNFNSSKNKKTSNIVIIAQEINAKRLKVTQTVIKNTSEQSSLKTQTKVMEIAHT